MSTYTVHFAAIEWDTGNPEDGHDTSELPSEYTVECQAYSFDDAYEVAADRMSDYFGFLFSGALPTVRRLPRTREETS
jgi:hypothetical protein